jgi:hypothetical protein
MSAYTLGPVEIAIVPLHEGASDPSTVRVSLDGEQGHEFVSLKQYDDEEVTLDFEEIPLLVEAVELLRQTASKKAVEENEPAVEEEETEEEEKEEEGKAFWPLDEEGKTFWPLPSESFLIGLSAKHILPLLTEPFSADNRRLLRAFAWKNSPQGHDYWSKFQNYEGAFGEEQKSILESWLTAHFKAKKKQAAKAKAEKEAEKAPAPSEKFLRSIDTEHTLRLLTKPFDSDNLSGAFVWSTSPQGRDYWSKFAYGDVSFGEQQKAIITSWLTALDELR